MHHNLYDLAHIGQSPLLTLPQLARSLVWGFVGASFRQPLLTLLTMCTILHRCALEPSRAAKFTLDLFHVAAVARHGLRGLALEANLLCKVLHERFGGGVHLYDGGVLAGVLDGGGGECCCGHFNFSLRFVDACASLFHVYIITHIYMFVKRFSMSF